MTASTPRTCKDKGRHFQQEIAAAIREAAGLPETDVVSRPMGSPGVDIMLSSRARTVCPFAIECKRCERTKAGEWWKQTKANAAAEHLRPCLIIRKNYCPPLVITDDSGIVNHPAHFFLLTPRCAFRIDKWVEHLTLHPERILLTRIGNEGVAIMLFSLFCDLLSMEEFGAHSPNSPSARPEVTE